MKQIIVNNAMMYFHHAIYYRDAQNEDYPNKGWPLQSGNRCKCSKVISEHVELNRCVYWFGESFVFIARTSNFMNYIITSCGTRRREKVVALYLVYWIHYSLLFLRSYFIHPSFSNSSQITQHTLCPRSELTDSLNCKLKL